MARRFWSTRVGTVLGLLAALLGGFALGGAWCSWRQAMFRPPIGSATRSPRRCALPHLIAPRGAQR